MMQMDAKACKCLQVLAKAAEKRRYGEVKKREDKKREEKVHFAESPEQRYQAISAELLEEIENAMNNCTKGDRISVAAKLCEIEQPEDDLTGDEPEKTPMQSLTETLIDALVSWQSTSEFSKKVERRETYE